MILGTYIAIGDRLDRIREKVSNDPQDSGMKKTMTAALGAAVLAALISASPGCSRTPDQIRFGVWASQNNLWDEAIFRWRKALQADPNSAAAHNNLGVAYEKKSLFQEALKEYEAALKLTPQDKYVKSNYQNCKENIRAAASDDDKKKAPDAKK
jgi:tetratricopeptide (TPR) repeat protein